MKKSIIVLSTFLILFAFVSCQKDINQPATETDITGNWKFISLEAKTSNIQEISDGTDVVKTITTSEYTTEKNSGTLTIDGTKMTTNNISYSINAVSKSSVYANGTLTDTLSLPVQFTAPASSAATTYKKIGTDSIYFEAGTGFMAGVSQNTQPGGAKLKLEKDKLYLIQSVTQSTTDNSESSTSVSTLQGTMTATFQRQ